MNHNKLEIFFYIITIIFNWALEIITEINMFPHQVIQFIAFNNLFISHLSPLYYLLMFFSILWYPEMSLFPYNESGDRKRGLIPYTFNVKKSSINWAEY